MSLFIWNFHVSRKTPSYEENIVKIIPLFLSGCGDFRLKCTYNLFTICFRLIIDGALTDEIMFFQYL